MITLLWRLTGLGVALAALAGAGLSYDTEPRVVTVGPGTLAGPTTLLFNVRIDDLSALMLAIVGVVGACVHVYSIGYLHERKASYHAIVTLFTLAMVTVVVADSLFLLLIGWEVMGTCSYLLIGHHWERHDARAGAVKAFLMTRLGDVGFLFGIFVIGLAAGTFQISEISVDRLSPATLTVGTLLLLCGVVGKSAQIPLQTWLPDAMPGPSPVSALIHAATMVAAGVFLVARMYDVFTAAPGTLAVLAVLASLTMLVAALCATAAVEVKRVLAWSTVSQLAIMFSGLALGTADGREGGLFHLGTHAAFKALLFLCAGVLLHQVGDATFATLRRRARHGVLRHLMPVTFGTMTIGLAALAGVPGLSGFFSKDAVVESAWHTARDGSWEAWVVLASVLLTAMLTAFYCTRMWLWVFFGSPAALGGLGAFEEDDSPYDEPDLAPGELRDGSPWMLGPLVLLAGIAAVAGYARADELDPVIAGVSTVVLLLGVVPAYSLWRRGADPRPVVLAREFGVDALYQATVVRPVRAAARLVVAGDNDVVFGYVRGAGRAAMLASAGFRRLQSGNAQAYLTAAVVGVVALAVIAGVVS